MTNRLLSLALALLILPVAGCSNAPADTELRDSNPPAESELREPAQPTEAGLRDSFASQLAANRAVSDFGRRDGDLVFTGPGLDGTGTAQWRVHIESAVIEPDGDAGAPYKGTVTSSWYADGQAVEPTGRTSNLPLVLMSNGLAQDCWALWDTDTGTWGWE